MTSAKISIVSEQGTHLLVSDGTRFAVVERRNQQFYNCHDDSRQGVPADQMNRIADILDAGDWTDQATAEATLRDIANRGSELAQRML